MGTLITNNGMMSSEVLNSWKEIATYVGRGVRTVQRWEAELGFPIRRPAGKGRSTVIALRAEIDLWLRACPLESRQLPDAFADSQGRTQMVRQATRELVSTSRQLREQMKHSCLELHSSLNDFVSSLEKLVAASRFKDKSVLVENSSSPTRDERWSNLSIQQQFSHHSLNKLRKQQDSSRAQFGAM